MSVSIHGLELTSPPKLQHDDVLEIDEDTYLHFPTEDLWAWRPSSIVEIQSAVVATPEKVKEPERLPNGLTVTYVGHRAEVVWAVDSKSLRKANRCGNCRQFKLQVGDLEMAMLLTVDPPTAGKKGTFRTQGKSDKAKLQLKCNESSQLEDKHIFFDVTFAAGQQPQRSAAIQPHDFTSGGEVLCTPSGEPLWDIPADDQWIIKVTITSVFAEANMMLQNDAADLSAAVVYQ